MIAVNAASTNPPSDDRTRGSAPPTPDFRQLAGKVYLLGSRFSVTHAYLFDVSNWAAAVKLDISTFRNLAAFRERMRAWPAGQAAMKTEGLK